MSDTFDHGLDALESYIDHHDGFVPGPLPTSDLLFPIMRDGVEKSPLRSKQELFCKDCGLIFPYDAPCSCPAQRYQMVLGDD